MFPFISVSGLRASILLFFCWLVALDASAQRVDSTFQTDSRKYVTPDFVLARPDGSYLVLGRHQYADGSLTGNLTCLQPDGFVNQTFQQKLGVLSLNGIYSTGSNPKLLAYADGRILVVAQENAALGSALYAPARLIRLLASGRPDSSFQFSSQARWPVLRTAILQADEKILLGGSSNAGGPLLMRLNADGTPDLSFTPPLTSGNSREFVSSVAVQPDGRILVAGYFGSPASALIRLLPNGQLDTSFQAGIAAGHNVQQVVLRPDGRLVVGGPANLLIQGHVGGIQQLLATGQLDAAFQAPAAYGIKNDNAEVRLTLLADGRLLVLPSAPATGPAMVLLLPSGSPDASFQLPAPLPLNLQQAIADARGQVLLVGNYNHKPGPMGTLHRLLATGTADSFFRPQLTVAGRIMSQLLLPDGRTLLAGTFDMLNNTRAGNIGCLSSAGEVDTAFARRSPFLNGVPGCLARQPNGNLLVGGSFQVGATTRGSLVRLLPTGTLDTTFLRIVSGYIVSSMATQPDGRILVGGTLAQSVASLNLARLLPNGQADNSFRISMTLSDWLRDVRHIAVQPDGRILLAGSQVHRVLSNGQYDPTYKATVLNSASNLLVRHMLLQPNGRLTLCGQMPGYGSSSRTTIIRLMPGGSVDSTFQDQVYQYFSARQLYYQADGKLLAGGFFLYGVSAGTLGLIRLDEVGNYDNMLAALPGYGDVASIGTDAAGRILLGGEFYYRALTSQQRLSLLRLLPVRVVTATVAAQRSGSCSVYPNPAHNWLRVAWTNAGPPQRLRILSLTGQVVKELAFQASKPEVWVGDLATGVYLMQASFQQGPLQTFRLSITR